MKNIWSQYNHTIIHSSHLFYTERNSELFSLPQNGSEQNSESLLLFLFHGTEFQVFFSSRKGFRTEFRDYASIFFSTERNSELFSLPGKGLEWNSERFLFHGTAGIPSKITICSVCSVFCWIIFLSEIPSPNPDTDPDPVPNQGFLGLAIFQIFGENINFFLFLSFFIQYKNTLHSATAKLVQIVILAGGMGEKNRKCNCVQSFMPRCHT